MQTQRPDAAVDDGGRGEPGNWRGAAATGPTPADAEITWPQAVTADATSSRRRKARRRSGWRPSTMPTAKSVASDCPWLMSRPPPRYDHAPASSAIRSPLRYPPSVTRHYSYSPPTSMPSPVKQRRLIDARFPPSDRERLGREPAWLSETTPRQQHGSMSLHCCVAIVSRCLHATGARNYAAHVANERQRQRRLTGNDAAMPVSDRRHDPTSRYCMQFQPTNAQHVDDGKQRTGFSSSSRPAVVRDARSGHRRARSRSDSSDSDASHRPCVRDLRYRPTYKKRGAMKTWPGTPYILTPGPAACDTEARRSRRQSRRDRHERRSTNDRSGVEKGAKKEKLHRYSVSSERSSTSSSASSSSSRSSSSSKDRRVRSKHSSTDELNDKTEDTKTAEMVSQTATDNTEANNSHVVSEERHKNTFTPPDVDSNAVDVPITDQVNEHDNADANVKHSPCSHGDGILDIGKTSDVSSDSSTNDFRPSVNNATSDIGLQSSLSDTRFSSQTPTVENKEVNKVEALVTHSQDSVGNRKLGEGDSEYIKADGCQTSPSGETNRHSRNGSRPRSENEEFSAETMKSENSAAEGHDHQTESTTESRERQKIHHHSRKRSRSCSRDGKSRKSSKQDDDRKHRTSSRHHRRERKRSHRRRSQSSSRGRHSFSASSDNDRSSSAVRNRLRRSPNVSEDRLKTEQRKLEKLRKKAEKAVRELQQLKLNFEETHPRRKKSRPRKTTKLSTTTTTTSVSEDGGLLDVNSNQRDWKCTQLASDKLADTADVDFIASYTSPVSSSSELSEGECNSDDDPESPLPTHLEQTSGKKQCDERERQADGAECGVITGNVREPSTAAIPSPSTVGNFTFFSTATNDHCSDVSLLDSKFNCDSAVTTTTTANDASRTVAVVDDSRTAQIGLYHDQDKHEPEQLASRENVGLINGCENATGGGESTECE